MITILGARMAALVIVWNDAAVNARATSVSSNTLRTKHLDRHVVLASLL